MKWSIVPERFSDGSGIAYSVYDEYGKQVAELLPLEVAALVAAAPDLKEACELQERLITDMSRNLPNMVLQDYALLNEAPLKAAEALRKVT